MACFILITKEYNKAQMDLALPIEKLRNVGARNLPRLHKLGIKTVRDLLWHLPARYEDYSQIIPINDLVFEQKATVQGTVVKIEAEEYSHGV